MLLDAEVGSNQLDLFVLGLLIASDSEMAFGSVLSQTGSVSFVWLVFF